MFLAGRVCNPVLDCRDGRILGATTAALRKRAGVLGYVGGTLTKFKPETTSWLGVQLGSGHTVDAPSLG